MSLHEGYALFAHDAADLLFQWNQVGDGTLATHEVIARLWELAEFYGAVRSSEAEIMAITHEVRKGIAAEAEDNAHATA